MNIEKIYIKNFGALKNYECEYSKGLNVIEGPNESGKSTLAEFIKFIFFGLSAKSDGSRVSERKKYQSFEDGSAGGYMEFESGGVRYRVERTIIPDINGVGRETVRTTNLDTNDECLKDIDPGVYFFGVDGEVFTQTAYISQAGGNSIDRPTVGQAIENMLFSGNELISVDAVSKNLEKEATGLLFRNNKGGEIYELNLEKNRLAEKIEEERSKNSRLLTIEFALKKQEAEKLELEGKLAKVKRELDGCEARRSISKLDALEEKERELSEHTQKRDEYLSANAYEGFMPDGEYVEGLGALANEVEFYGSELEKAKEEKKALGSDKIDADDIALINKVQSDGGSGSLSDFFENKSRSAHSSMTIGIFFVVFTLIWGAVGAVCMFIEDVASISLGDLFTMYEVSFGLYGVAALMLIIAIILFIRSHTISKKIDKKLEFYGATSEDDIFVAINGAMSRASSQEIYIEKLSAAEGKCKRVEKEITTREDEIRSRLEKWGKTYEGIPTLRDTIREAQNLISELSKLNEDINISAAQRDTMKEAYSGLDRAAAEAIIATAATTPTPEEEKALSEEAATINERLAELSNKVKEYEIERAKLGASDTNIAELLDKYDEISHKVEELTKRHAVLTLAQSTLGKAGDDLRTGISPKLSMHAAEFMRVATNDKYRGLNISQNLAVKYGMESGGVSFVSRDEDYMSEGTRDLAYLSLRLALVGFLYKKELPPLVFDEAFSRLDDLRLAGITAVIGKYAEESGQVFVLTSQKRDAAIMSCTANISHIKIGV